MDMAETTAHGTTGHTNEEPYIHEFTAIYGSYHVLGDRLYLYIVALLSAVWLYAQWRRYTTRDLNAGCWYVWDALGLTITAVLSQQQKWALACVSSRRLSSSGPGYQVAHSTASACLLSAGFWTHRPKQVPRSPKPWTVSPSVLYAGLQTTSLQSCLAII